MPAFGRGCWEQIFHLSRFKVTDSHALPHRGQRGPLDPGLEPGTVRAWPGAAGGMGWGLGAPPDGGALGGLGGGGGQVQDAGGEALVSPGARARRWASCAGTRSGQGVVQSPPSLTGHLLIRLRHEGGRSHPDLPSPELCLPSTSPMRPVLPGGNGGVWRAQRGWGASGGGGTELGGSGRRDCLRAPPASLGRPG